MRTIDRLKELKETSEKDKLLLEAHKIAKKNYDDKLEELEEAKYNLKFIEESDYNKIKVKTEYGFLYSMYYILSIRRKKIKLLKILL